MPLHPAVTSKDLPPAPDRLPVGIIDAHTHLDACGADDADGIRVAMDRAAAVGVCGAVTVGDDITSSRWAARAATQHETLYAAVAIHPTSAGTLTDTTKAELEDLARRPRVVAIGETGLDYYWDSAPPTVQAESFAWHIDLAKRVRKPLMIHDRDAHADILDILRAEGAPETVVFHCFSGGVDLARQCADAGYIMSFAGPVSFRNARELVDAAKIAPIGLIMVETDAPFLPPHPYRGRRNEPFALPYTVRALAEIREVDVESLCVAVRSNTARTYGITLKP